jgi:hypothetical protein
MLCAFAIYSLKQDCHRPILEDDTLSTPSLRLSPSSSIKLIPKTSSLEGKTLRTLGISVILAQIGCYAPLKQFTCSVFRVMLSKGNVKDSLEFGMSHFQSELALANSVVEAAAHASGRVLCLFD